jgi:tryptophan synthase alpha chain
VTGSRENLADTTVTLVNRVRRHTDIPVLAGFGISKKEHAATVTSAGADGAITGSAYAQIYATNIRTPEDSLSEITQLITQIKQGCVEGYRKRSDVHPNT